MSMYALGILPLINQLHGLCKQVWFADDATGAGKLSAVREWWNAIVEYGPNYGYHPNATKTWLIVKECQFENGRQAFMGTNVQITTRGKRHLGAALGNTSFVNQYVGEKVQDWIQQIECLSNIAKTQPHVVYSAFTRGLVHRWSYLLQTVPDIASLIKPLEDAIRHKFLPSLTGQNVFGPEMRDTLPCLCHAVLVG
ncbi:uncharacterized protein LOC134195988 [Corticium candelabrum]|uniref:uncharacterized protein LOC134195988 n=1 Tax=Corticium candelabrum TaxID=121492 RepID=UPI002E26A129|nr:uncharacterized protein LOC134195988 [Corticium candelabrum]